MNKEKFCKYFYKYNMYIVIAVLILINIIKYNIKESFYITNLLYYIFIVIFSIFSLIYFSILKYTIRLIITAGILIFSLSNMFILILNF